MSKAKNSEAIVRLPKDVLIELKALSDLMKVSPLVALRYAIAKAKFIQDEIRNKGSTIVIRRKDNKLYEVIWNSPEKVSESRQNHDTK